MANKNNKNKNKNKNQAIKVSHSLPQVRGNGGYYSDAVVPFMRKVVPDGTFRTAGGTAGGLLGAVYGPNSSRLGSLGGSMLGGKLSQLLGFGDYAVRSNSLMTRGMALPEGTEVPTFKREGRVTTVTHREFIKDILVPAGPTVFTNQTFAINAANATLFPWLAPIAANFQQYKFNGLVFEFKTLSSDITAGGALGAVILATDYDVNSVSFPTKIVMENSEYAVSAKPSCSQMHAVECATAETASKLLYCRDSTQNLSSTSDNRLYDLGKFEIATTGLPGSTGQVLGELWVTYDVALYKPEIASVNSTSTLVTANTAISKTSCFGSTPTIVGSLVAGAINTLTWSAVGSYFFEIDLDGTVFAAPTLTGSAVTTVLQQPGPLPGTLTTAVFVFKAVVTTAGQTSVFDFSASTSVSASRARIVTYDGIAF